MVIKYGSLFVDINIFKYLCENNFIMTNEQILIQHQFEFQHKDNSRTHYSKDLGGDGYTFLHIFLKGDSFSAEYEEYLLEDDGSQYDLITKEPVLENESLTDFLNRIK